MRRARVLILAGTVMLLAAPAARSGPQGGRFSLVLHRSTAGWVAQCLAGCAWTSFTFDTGAQPIRISYHGVTAASAPEGDTTRFVFDVQLRGTGWNATAVHGTAWRTLQWNCPRWDQECAARISDSGVVGARTVSAPPSD